MKLPDLLELMLEDTMDGYRACETIAALGPEAIEQAIKRAERAGRASSETSISRAQINLSGALCKAVGDAEAERTSREFFGDERHWHIAMFARGKVHASKFMRALAGRVPEQGEVKPVVRSPRDLRRGDITIIDSSGGRARRCVVLGREVEEHSTSVWYVTLGAKGALGSEARVMFLSNLNAPEVLGLFEDLAALPPVPSDSRGTHPGESNAPEQGAEGEAKMATITRKKSGGAKKATAAKKATSNGGQKSRAKFSPTKQDVTAIAKRLRDGTKMNEIKADLGLSNGQPIRNALLEHGFDSKGRKNTSGKTARELQAEARKSAPAKKAAKKSPAKKAAAKKADPSDQA